MKIADIEYGLGVERNFVIDPCSKKVIAHYNHTKNGLPNDLIRTINQDSEGKMWIGTFGEGLAVYTPDMKEVARFNSRSGFCSNSINYIFKDSNEQCGLPQVRVSPFP